MVLYMYIRFKEESKLESKQQTIKSTNKPAIKPKMVFAIDPGCASSGFAVYDGTKKTKDHTPKFSNNYWRVGFLKMFWIHGKFDNTKLCKNY